MIKSKLMIPFLVVAFVLGMSMTTVQAQGGGGGGRGGQGQGQGGGRGGNMADMQARMAERMKTTLGVNDEEWAVLAPAIEKVTTLQRDARGGGAFGGRGGRGGQPGAQPTAPQSDVAKASEALRTALADETSSADSIKTKLAALRAARTKAQESLKKAQDELREILNTRQEAQLVMTGLLD